MWERTIYIEGCFNGIACAIFYCVRFSILFVSFFGMEIGHLEWLIHWILTAIILGQVVMKHCHRYEYYYLNLKHIISGYIQSNSFIIF